MLCKGCYPWAALSPMTVRRSGGRTESAHFCQACQVCCQNLHNGLPTSLPFPNLLIAVILAVLDTALVCLLTAKWMDTERPWVLLVLCPVQGGLIGILLGLETYLLWLAKGRPKTAIVIGSAKPKSDHQRGNLWDSELDG